MPCSCGSSCSLSARFWISDSERREVSYPFSPLGIPRAEGPGRRLPPLQFCVSRVPVHGTHLPGKKTKEPRALALQ